MFRSVFTKFVSLFMLILLASFLVLTTILTSLVNTYNVDVKMNSMADAAYSVSVFLREEYMASEHSSFVQYLENEDGHVMPVVELLSINVDDMVLWVVDKDGNTLLTGGSGRLETASSSESEVSLPVMN